MEDISNKVIFVLVILTVVISIFSTVLLLGNVDPRVLGRSQISQSEQPVGSSRVSYKIQKPVLDKVEDNSNAEIKFKIENP